MGNLNSNSNLNSLYKNKSNINNDDNDSIDYMQDFTKLSQSNAAFITKLNEIASTPNLFKINVVSI